MNITDKFQFILEQATESAIQGIRTFNWPKLTEAARKVDDQFARVEQGAFDKPDPEQLATLRESWLSNRWSPQTPADLRKICLDATTLLSRPGNWPERLEILTQSDIMDRRSWLSLLMAYWRGDFTEEGKRKDELRIIIQKNLPEQLPKQDGTRWQQAIRGYLDLFAPDAETRLFEYGNLDRKTGTELLKNIHAEPGSWLYQGLILVDIRALVMLPNDKFQESLEVALAELLPYEKHTRVFSRALIMILEKCSDIATIQPVDILKTSALKLWGHPAIRANAHHWDQLSTKARQMMTQWITKWDLERFFHVLDGQSNEDSRRRFHFWRSWLDQMTATQIIFGRAANDSKDHELRKLKRELISEKRYCCMPDGTPENNAFVFQIKGHTFVEFSSHGRGACYVADPSEIRVLPNMIRFGESIPPTVLESALKFWPNGHQRRWVHSGDWTNSFRSRISYLQSYDV